MATKEQKLLEECVYPHHNLFVNADQYNLTHLNTAVSSWEKFATGLAEEALAHASNGAYSVVNNAPGYDYTDGSDFKTSSITRLKRGQGTARVQIQGAVTPSSGNLKIGALRVAVFNALVNRLDYFYLPKSAWSQHVSSVSSVTNAMAVIGSYNLKKDHYNWMEEFRVATFVDLATAM